MHLEKVEGLVLQAMRYQDHHHIVTAFTRERGVIRLFVRGGRHALANPLTRAELLYALPRSTGLFRLRDATILDQHLALRQSLATLEAGCSMASKVASSQLLCKPAPALYILLLAYLERATENPETLSASFALKLLKHEGVLSLEGCCGQEATRLADGELLCNEHAPHWAIPFSQDEISTLRTLMESRSLSAIAQLELSASLREKIECLFASRYSRT